MKHHLTIVAALPRAGGCQSSLPAEVSKAPSGVIWSPVQLRIGDIRVGESTYAEDGPTLFAPGRITFIHQPRARYFDWIQLEDGEWDIQETDL